MRGCCSRTSSASEVNGAPLAHRERGFLLSTYALSGCRRWPGSARISRASPGRASRKLYGPPRPASASRPHPKNLRLDAIVQAYDKLGDRTVAYAVANQMVLTLREYGIQAQVQESSVRSPGGSRHARRGPG